MKIVLKLYNLAKNIEGILVNWYWISLISIWLIGMALIWYVFS